MKYRRGGRDDRRPAEGVTGDLLLVAGVIDHHPAEDGTARLLVVDADRLPAEDATARRLAGDGMARRHVGGDHRHVEDAMGRHAEAVAGKDAKAL